MGFHLIGPHFISHLVLKDSINDSISAFPGVYLNVPSLAHCFFYSSWFDDLNTLYHLYAGDTLTLQRILFYLFKHHISETSSDANITKVDYVLPWLRELRDQYIDNYYTEHCSVWSYQFYWYDQYVQDDSLCTGWRFLRWPDGAIRKILFIYLFFVNLIYIIFN